MTKNSVNISETSTNKLIANLEKLSNNYSVRDDFSTPLTHDEIESLIDDLRNRQLDIKSSSGNKCLSHIGISINRFSNNIMEGTSDKKVHPLLSRLYKTKRDYFYITEKGYLKLANTSTKKLITNLEKFNASN